MSFWFPYLLVFCADSCMILPLCYADYMTPVSAETVHRLVTTTPSQVKVHWNPAIHKNPATMESNLIQVVSSMSFQSGI